MAVTNTNTDEQVVLSSDIYDISAFIDQIRKQNIESADETSSMVGIFGYLNEIFSNSIQNALIVASQTSNEAMPTRAKFIKNVVAHAMSLGITDIYAKPASMVMMFYLPISYVEQNFVVYNELGSSKFIIDKNIPINIEGFEYHFDYDIIITRIKNPQDSYVYTAIYDLFEPKTTIIKDENTISDITNPYITTLIQTTNENGEDCIAFSAKLHQVSIDTVEHTVLTDNSIENKTVTFEFNGQLCSFDIYITNNQKTIRLTPIYQGLSNMDSTSYWCYYEFIDETTIRILFDSQSYIPELNDVISIKVKTCSGSSANFNYNSAFKTNFISELYNNYNGMIVSVQPLSNGTSSGGRDKKSLKDLKQIIPREASARGAIVNTYDLQNFFNSLTNDTYRIYFNSKKDNQFERTYHGYVLMKKDGYIYPTNTLNIKIKQDDFKGFSGNNNVFIKPGTIFYYYDHGSDIENDYATTDLPENTIKNKDGTISIINKDGNKVRVFDYTIPFLVTIDDDLITTYLLTIMDENKLFKFNSINSYSNMQFIATNMNWSRNFIYEDEEEYTRVYDNKYTMTMDIIQNTDEEYNLVEFEYDDENINILNCNIKVLMVLYTDTTGSTPYKYAEAQITDYDPDRHIYTFKFIFETDDTFDLNSHINISGLYNIKSDGFIKKTIFENNNFAYMNKEVFAKIFILARFHDDNDNVILYPNENMADSSIGNRTEIDNLIMTKDNVIKAFFDGNESLELITSDETNSVVEYNLYNIVNSNSLYKRIMAGLLDIDKLTVEDIEEPEEYNRTFSNIEILNFIKDNEKFKKLLLKDRAVKKLIDEYTAIDISDYTVCNTLTIDGGIHFYSDYSTLMSSTVGINKTIQSTNNGKLLYTPIIRKNEFGQKFIEFVPKYAISEKNNGYIYEYNVNRIPLICNDYLDSETLFQNYISDLEELRKYIESCLYILEDTFGIDLKFFNTYGPSKRFYYNIPSSTSYKAKICIKSASVLSDIVDPTSLICKLPFETTLDIIEINGQWGKIEQPVKGWIRLADITKITNYIDNVALKFKFAMQLQPNADGSIISNIINDIKEYIEDINEISEIHIPNIITLITNNYREHLVYFEFMDVNGYGQSCQHLYHDDTKNPDICPEFLNISTTKDGIPEVTIDEY